MLYSVNKKRGILCCSHITSVISACFITVKENIGIISERCCW